MATYKNLVNKVRDWANRDIAALSDTVIQDSIRYAADTAYRTLRIPPLESTVRWDNTENALTDATSNTSNIYQSITTLQVPTDLIEFIHIRGTDENGLTTRVFNEKADIRSFWDITTDRYNNAAFWSRQGCNVLLSPAFGLAGTGFYGGGSGPEAMIEMYYYRRLPALDAAFDVTPSNFASGNLNRVTVGGVPLYFDSGVTDPIPGADTAYAEDAFGRTFFNFEGVEASNWLRDENEKIVLMGALAEVFAYLQEDDQAAKYLQLFEKEIAELNDEDRMRDSSGGNIQTQYTARGLI